MTDSSSEEHTHKSGNAIVRFVTTYVFATDHKIIGLQFLFSTLIWFAIGGMMAMAMRWQLAWPGTEIPILGSWLFPEQGGQITEEFYNMLFTMHATIMIFFVMIPIFGWSVWELSDSAHDRGQRHGLSSLEHAELLVHVARFRLHDPKHADAR